jgi:aminotransferase in exopolysaccharide biosynthesis
MSKSPDLPIQVIDAIRSVVGSEPAVLHEPSFDGNELAYLRECIDSTFVSSIGKFVDRFEMELSKFTGAKHAVAVVNGTAALHVCLRLAGVQAEDEVLVPALTFVATANAVTYCNASPHFIDSEEYSFGVDAHKLRDYLNSSTEQRAGRCINRNTGRVIRAMIVMHAFGHPADMDSLLSVAHDFNITLLEDAAESLGSYYKKQHTSTFGLMGALSFNGNKTITTGGGGAILTNNSSLARYAKHLTTTAKLQHPWEFQHDEVGYNYRLPNLNAAIGCAQMEQLPDKLADKRRLFSLYKKAFEGIAGLRLIAEPNNCQSNYWLNTLLLDSENIDQRDAILKGTNDAGIMTRPVWKLIHQLEPFKDCPRMSLSTAISLSRRIINIPSSSFLSARAL